MNNTQDETVKLFSYGTLLYETVQLSVFGRELKGAKDKLKGYMLSVVEITDPTVLTTSGAGVHPILVHTGNSEDEVNGIVLSLTENDLKLADQYEVGLYKRVLEKLDSGICAWVYVAH